MSLLRTLVPGDRLMTKRLKPIYRKTRLKKMRIEYTVTKGKKIRIEMSA